MPSPPELRGAFAGAIAIGLAYSAGRSYGLTRSDIARRRGARQSGRGPRGAACARHARVAARCAFAHTGAAIAGGAALGALASREGPAFSAGAHALAALVAQRVSTRGARRRS